MIFRSLVVAFDDVHALCAFVFIHVGNINLPSIHFGIGSNGLTLADLVDCGSIEISG